MLDTYHLQFSGLVQQTLLTSRLYAALIVFIYTILTPLDMKIRKTDMNSNNFDTTFFSGYFKIILISYNHKETKKKDVKKDLKFKFKYVQIRFALWLSLSNIFTFSCDIINKIHRKRRNARNEDRKITKDCRFCKISSNITRKSVNSECFWCFFQISNKYLLTNFQK